MDRATWERIQDLFHRAREIPPAERGSFLASECADPAIARRVREMLAADEADATPILDAPLGAVAERLLDGQAPPGAPNQRFGPYTVRRLLGEGGMGTVFLAVRDDLESEAALKILRDASLSPSRRERFQAEQRALAQLHHPSIAQLYDAGTLPDGTPWFVMEYVEGVPLTEYCRRRETSLRGRLLLFRAVTDAVRHAHRHAIVHRDLKPSNVLVKDDGSVRLLDFGIAKQLEGDEPADQTRTGLRLMTPAYAAPEQLRGEQVGTFTDVYALGVILYELLTGRVPHDLSRLNPAAMIPAVGEPPARPSQRALRGLAGLGRGEWADLDVLCLTAMHPDPARRYQTVDALIADIDHFLDGAPLDARPDTVSYRLAKFVRRHRSGVVAGTLAILTFLATVIFYTVRLRAARDGALAESARTQRVQQFMENLLQGGEDDAGPADSLRVTTLIDRGLLEVRSLDAEPEAQADLLETLGGLYTRFGKLDRADSLLRAALERRERLYPPGSAPIARSLAALGQLRTEQASYDSAEALLDSALALYHERLPADHPDALAAATSLARVFEETGRYDRAIALLSETARAQGVGRDTTPELLATLYGLANNHFYAGHYDTSDSLNRTLLVAYRRRFGEAHPNVADALTNLGAIQHEKGNYAEAERYHRQALEIVRRWYGEDHPRTATGLTQVGRALLYEDRYDEALTLQRQALAILERVYGPNHPRVASALNDIGGVAYMRDQYDVAEPAYQRVIEIYRSVYGERHYQLGTAISNLGGVYLDRRQYAEAERLFRQALAIFVEALQPDNVNIGIAQIKLGRTLLRARRFGEAAEASRAGYDILIKQSNPAASFVRASRRDLAAAYDSLGQTELADRFKRELADTT
ncbi:MAG: tetratricopeptide repeat protein [Gemmatimonadales bacterium]